MWRPLWSGAVPSSRMTLRQRYIAFGIVFAILTVGGMIGLGYWLSSIDDQPPVGEGVAPVPEVAGTGKVVSLSGKSVKMESGANGLAVGRITYELTGSAALGEKLVATHGGRIRVVGNLVSPRERIVSVNRFFDLSDPGAGPTPPAPDPLPPERPTSPGSNSPARTAEPGTPGATALDNSGRPTGQRLPNVGQRVRIAGVIRVDPSGEIILVDNRGDTHRVWGAPDLIRKLRTLDQHRVIVSGTAILGSGSNRNFTIRADRVIDRGRITTPAEGGAVPPTDPQVIDGRTPATGGSVTAPAPPPLFSSGFEDGTTGWASGCGGDGARQVLDAGACGNRGSARIGITGEPVRSGSRALMITTLSGDGGGGVDENSLPWTGDVEGESGTVSRWKISFRLRDAQSQGTIAKWRSVGCPDAPAPVEIITSRGSLSVATSGGSCSQPTQLLRPVYDGDLPWVITPGVWYDIVVAIRWSPLSGSVAVQNGSVGWSTGGKPVGYAEPNNQTIIRLGLARSSSESGEGVVYFDDVSYTKG